MQQWATSEAAQRNDPPRWTVVAAGAAAAMPAGNLKGNGMCKGLDYFSIDSYRDDPAAEVAASKAAYASLIPKLNKPNAFESRACTNMTRAHTREPLSWPQLQPLDPVPYQLSSWCGAR